MIVEDHMAKMFFSVGWIDGDKNKMIKNNCRKLMFSHVKHSSIHRVMWQLAAMTGMDVHAGESDS